MHQVEAVSLDILVPANHPYRLYSQSLDFDRLTEPLSDLTLKGAGAKGYGIRKLFRCLLLQFMVDISDRELARYLQENNAAKLFCGFRLMDTTPDFSLFTKVRKRIGTKRMSQVFACARAMLHEQGYGIEALNFVDATHLISKANLWEERDKAIAAKEKSFNNQIAAKVTYDKQARIGCKGKNKFWLGYKQHVSVDMASGMIEKVAITPANVSDAAGLKHICPRNKVVIGDKGYCVNPAKRTMARRNCHDASIKKNNMKSKDRVLDRTLSSMRAPFERVFSKRNRRVRYVGIAKNQFSAFFYALCHNMKRQLVLQGSPPIALAWVG